MSEQPEQLKIKALQELEGVTSADKLEQWRVRYLGRKGELTLILRSLAELPPDERKTLGARANQTKVSLEEALKQKEQVIKEAQLVAAKKGGIDITLPGRPLPAGRLHPITQTLHEICDIFSAMGFQVVEGPEAEWDYYNFEALNIPPEHPARDTQSTFWIAHGTGNREKSASVNTGTIGAVSPSVRYEMEGGEKPMLLRTQTTSVTARTIAEVGEGKRQLPIMVVEPGKVYRYEATDATHGWMLYQIDGLVVDKHITMADLKGALYEFVHRYFGADRKVRFRADYFPFVEPGVEVAIECAICRGDGCRLCGDSGWIEIAGAGMTHPDVLRRGGIDPDVYTSFAFGMGADRTVMLRYGVDDIRLFYGSDLRFLRQF
ncbi:MAG: phenylalanine--tRNA ligase subunit alpha [Chloroflexi bacterium]|nr:phenylalanine--tRNA ligase subunit alpha [Chloroflexota bacterium]